MATKTKYLKHLGYNNKEIETIINSTNPEDIVKARKIWENRPNKDKRNETNGI